MSQPLTLRARRRLLLLAALAVPAGLFLLYRYAPTADSLYPRCLFHTVTGLHCPGCGTTRCLHALLHGQFRQAAAYNALALLALPFLLFWAARWGLAFLRGVPLRARPLPAWAYVALVAVVLAFWVLRNLNVPPFDALAPHAL
ncbi:MAG TPA: DUF2752 domain-containing protein [Gemmataceae bacterium]|jgi:hypothetical protein|nr:DUF2752 domain-containing protein [Gemmataceae bacterium]